MLKSILEIFIFVCIDVIMNCIIKLLYYGKIVLFVYWFNIIENLFYSYIFLIINVLYIFFMEVLFLLFELLLGVLFVLLR